MPAVAKPTPQGPETLQGVAEQLNALEAAAAKAGPAGLNGSSGTSSSTSSGSRATLLSKLWTLILQSNAKAQEDLLKPLPPLRLLLLIEDAPRQPEAAYAAAGCLAGLAGHPRWLAELTATPAMANRLVSACVSLLCGPHDRSRLPAVQLLQALAACPLQVPRLAAALPRILELLSEVGGPGWAGGRQLAAAAAAVLAALLAPSECEPAAQQQARRCTCLAAGGVQSLLLLLHGEHGGGVLMPAAACLRYLALAPGAAEVMAGDPAVAAQLLQLLSPGRPDPPAVCAYVAGILWELAAAPAAAEQLLAAGALPALLGVVQATAAAAAAVGGGAKKKGAKGKGGKAAAKNGSNGDKGSSSSGGSKGKQDKKAAAAAAAGAEAQAAAAAAAAAAGGPSCVLLQDPQAAAEVALCNAAGALHHLSFLDAAKAELGSCQQLPLLVTLMGHTKGQTYDNLVGVLWNVGLLGANGPSLAAAGAPGHLVRPVPARWSSALPALSSCRPGSAAAAAAAGASCRSGPGAAASAAVGAAGGVVLVDGCVRQTTLRFVG